MKDLGYLSDVAYGYSNYLNRIVKGDAVVDDLINYAQGITERDEWPEALYAVYFESAEPEVKKELINLVRDCYNAVHIENKKGILAQMNDKQLQTLAGYYDDMEQLLNANKKNNLIKYFDNADYTSNNSYQAQSELRYVLTCIQDLLNEKNYAASSEAEASQSDLQIERIHDATEEAYSQDGAQLQYVTIQ